MRDDGVLDIVGVAPEHVTVDRFPWQGELHFALVLRLEASDDLENLGLRVAVVRGTDQAVVGRPEAGAMRITRNRNHADGAPVLLPAPVVIPTTFDAPGQYAVTVHGRVDGRMAFVPFAVVSAGS